MSNITEVENRDHVALRHEEAQDAGMSTAEFLSDILAENFYEVTVATHHGEWKACLHDTFNCGSAVVATASCLEELLAKMGS